MLYISGITSSGFPLPVDIIIDGNTGLYSGTTGLPEGVDSAKWREALARLQLGDGSSDALIFSAFAKTQNDLVTYIVSTMKVVTSYMTYVAPAEEPPVEPPAEEPPVEPTPPEDPPAPDPEEFDE